MDATPPIGSTTSASTLSYPAKIGTVIAVGAVSAAILALMVRRQVATVTFNNIAASLGVCTLLSPWTLEGLIHVTRSCFSKQHQLKSNRSDLLRNSDVRPLNQQIHDKQQALSILVKQGLWLVYDQRISELKELWLAAEWDDGCDGELHALTVTCQLMRIHPASQPLYERVEKLRAEMVQHTANEVDPVKKDRLKKIWVEAGWDSVFDGQLTLRQFTLDLIQSDPTNQTLHRRAEALRVGMVQRMANEVDPGQVNQLQEAWRGAGWDTEFDGLLALRQFTIAQIRTNPFNFELYEIEEKLRVEMAQRMAEENEPAKVGQLQGAWTGAGWDLEFDGRLASLQLILELMRTRHGLELRERAEEIRVEMVQRIAAEEDPVKEKRLRELYAVAYQAYLLQFQPEAIWQPIQDLGDQLKILKTTEDLAEFDLADYAIRMSIAHLNRLIELQPEGEVRTELQQSVNRASTAHKEYIDRKFSEGWEFSGDEPLSPAFNGLREYVEQLKGAAISQRWQSFALSKEYAQGLLNTIHRGIASREPNCRHSEYLTEVSDRWTALLQETETIWRPVQELRTLVNALETTGDLAEFDRIDFSIQQSTARLDELIEGTTEEIRPELQAVIERCRNAYQDHIGMFRLGWEFSELEPLHSEFKAVRAYVEGLKRAATSEGWQPFDLPQEEAQERLSTISRRIENGEPNCRHIEYLIEARDRLAAQLEEAETIWRPVQEFRTQLETFKKFEDLTEFNRADLSVQQSIRHLGNLIGRLPNGENRAQVQRAVDDGSAFHTFSINTMFSENWEFSYEEPLSTEFQHLKAFVTQLNAATARRNWDRIDPAAQEQAHEYLEIIRRGIESQDPNCRHTQYLMEAHNRWAAQLKEAEIGALTSFCNAQVAPPPIQRSQPRARPEYQPILDRLSEAEEAAVQGERNGIVQGVREAIRLFQSAKNDLKQEEKKFKLLQREPEQRRGNLQLLDDYLHQRSQRLLTLYPIYMQRGNPNEVFDGWKELYTAYVGARDTGYARKWASIRKELQGNKVPHEVFNQTRQHKTTLMLTSELPMQLYFDQLEGDPQQLPFETRFITTETLGPLLTQIVSTQQIVLSVEELLGQGDFVQAKQRLDEATATIHSIERVLKQNFGQNQLVTPKDDGFTIRATLTPLLSSMKKQIGEIRSSAQAFSAPAQQSAMSIAERYEKIRRYYPDLRLEEVEERIAKAHLSIL